MSLQVKFALWVLLILTASVACLGYGIYGSRRVLASAQEARLRSFVALETANGLIKTVDETRDLFLQILNEQDGSLMESVAEHESAFQALVDSLKVRGEGEELDAIQRDYATYTNDGKLLLARFIKDKNLDAVRKQASQIGPLARALNERISGYRRFQERRFQGSLRIIESHAQRLSALSMAVGGILILCVLGMMLWLGTVLRPIRTLTRYVQSLRDGDLESALTIAKRSDEIFVLQTGFEEMRLALKAHVTDLETKVRERTRSLELAQKEIHDVFQSIEQGIFTFAVADIALSPQASRRTTMLFGVETLAGVSLAELLRLSPEQESQLREWVKMIAHPSRVRHWAYFKRLFPLKELWVEAGGITRCLQLDCQPILTEGILTRVMILATDITATRQMEKQLDLERQQKTDFLDYVNALLAAEPGEIKEFLDDVGGIVANLRELPRARWQGHGEWIRGRAHTLKGLAGMFGLHPLTRILHAIENDLEQAGKEMGELADPPPTWVSRLEHELANIEGVRHRIYGKYETSLPVNRDRYEALLADLKNGELREPDKVLKRVLRLKVRSFEEHCRKYRYLVEHYRGFSDKRVEDLEIGHPMDAVDDGPMEACHECIVHLIRNALDHGLEDRVEQERLGKKGRICIDHSQEEAWFVLLVSDNGRGVDADAVTSAAVAQGVVSEADAAAMTQEQKCDLIFREGVTTRHRVNEYSGRGLGLHVVREQMEHLGGRVEVISEPGQGSVFRLRIPL